MITENAEGAIECMQKEFDKIIDSIDKSETIVKAMKDSDKITYHQSDVNKMR